MKLDRNMNPDGTGRYALIQIRELTNSEHDVIHLCAGSEGRITIPARAIRTGSESPGDQFFVLKYKDKFSAPALRAYADAVDEEASALRNDGKHAECDELREFAEQIRDEAEKANRSATKTPTPMKNTPTPAPGGSAAPSCSAGHLIDYVRRLHIITGPNGQCMCGEGGITCSERLRQVSHEIGAALCAANLLPETPTPLRPDSH